MRIASLFLETAYSFSGSNILIEPLIEKAKQAGYQTLVLSDKKMHAAYQFYRICRKHDIAPVIGLQVKLEGIFSQGFIAVNCYAQNEIGYKNLLKISSLQSYNETLPFTLFKKYNEAISVLLTNHEGEYKDLSPQEKKTLIHELKQHSQKLYVADLEEASVNNDFGVSTLMVDTVAYMEEEDAPLYPRLETVLQHRSTNRFSNCLAHFKSLDFFTQYPQDNLEKLSSFLENHEITLSQETPTLPRYRNEHNLDSKEYLRALSHKGLEKRLKDYQGDAKKYFQRLNDELQTIHSLGYDDYFLIVWDVVRFARNEKILVGPGRGSAPGSLVSYALGITSVDPLKFNLMFERFLNQARSSMPDIDIDFPDYAREKIIEYTVKRYGREYVSYICTFGTFLKRSALRESARGFDIDKKHLDEIVRISNRYDSVSQMIETDLDALNRINSHDAIKEWLLFASAIEGLPKHVSTHAAGIILSHEPITEYSAIQEGLGGHHQTQFSQEDLEAIGLLKMDFLGLRNLTMIEDVLAYIASRQEESLDVYRLPLDDALTFKLLSEQSTTGIFQLESPGMRQLIKELQIWSFEDIVTVLALFRPGPMQSIKTYLKRRHKKEKVTYLSPELKEILEPTEGILLYQEQIMEIAKTFAGYSLIEADLLRRAVSKKDETILQNERQSFVDKSVQLGKDSVLADKIYDYIVTFANYGFNRSHSVAYAVIAYWMAYLKAHYPAYFIAVLMQSALGNHTLLSDYRLEAQALGIILNAPDVTISETRFVLREKDLYYPLNGIRNIGKIQSNALVEERDKHPYHSFADFMARTKSFINKRNYEALIKAGACDRFGYTRKTLLENIEALSHYIDYQGKDALERFVYTAHSEFPIDLLRSFQEEALGIHFTAHRLDDIAKELPKDSFHRLVDAEQLPIERPCAFLGEIARIHKTTTKQGETMAFVSLDDYSVRLDTVVFPKTFAVHQKNIALGNVVIFKGKLTVKQKERQLIVDDIVIVPHQADKQGDDHL